MAVAEKHGKLDVIVTHYASNHLESNVTSMILLGTPSSSGQKPNQKKCQTRRKRPQKQSSVKKVSRFQLPCSSTSDTSKTISTPSCSHASFSFDGSTNYSGTSRSTSLSFAYEDNSLNLGTLPPTNPFNDQAYYYGCGPYQQGLLPPSNYHGTMYTHCIGNPVPSPYPFIAKFITARITKCQGCGHNIRAGNTDLQPPHDLIVSHLECRPYYNKHRQEICTPNSPSNAHYHLNYYCIQAAEPTFCGINLSIPDDIKGKLKQTHKDFILNQIGLNVL